MLDMGSTESSCGLNVPDDLAVDSAGDAVLELQVHLGDGVLGEYGGIGDITCVALVFKSPMPPLLFCSDAVRACPGDVRMAADSTMLRMVNLLIALSLGVHREQLEQRMGLTWPRPFLFRPLDARFLTMAADSIELCERSFGLREYGERTEDVSRSQRWGCCRESRSFLTSRTVSTKFA